MTEAVLLSKTVLAVQSCIALAVLIYVWMQIWPKLRIDVFRQEMFGIRNELFLYAASGKISFTHPAYRLLRKSMNGYIRYGHRLGLFSMAVTTIEWRLSGATPDLSWFKNWEDALKTIKDPDVRRALKTYHIRAETLVLRSIASRSLIVMFVVLTAGALMLLHGEFRGVRKRLRRATRKTVSVLVDPRLIEADAARTMVA